jgi:hypothetical protein
MTSRELSRFALGVFAASAMLAGCGGSQPPISAPGAMPQTLAIATHAERGKSWMLPGSSSGDLIYATGGCGGTCVVSYPALKYVGAIQGSGSAICSDEQGNIFISDGSSITEYAHGGTQPIATLNVPGSIAAGCSVDPNTNNLAVVFKGNGVDIAVFSNERGTPKVYGSGIDSKYCAYDDHDNLFVSGYYYSAPAVSELPNGSGSAQAYILDGSVGTPGQIQWDGHYVSFESEDQPAIFSQMTFSGSKVTIVGTVSLKGIKHRQNQSWIYGGNVIVPFNDRGTSRNVVGIWRYPKGGKIVKSIRKYDSYKKAGINFAGVTISVAPH